MAIVFRITILLLLLGHSSEVWSQKRQLGKGAKFWENVDLPKDDEGNVSFSGSFTVIEPEEALYSTAEEWVILNNRGPHNKWILQNRELKKLIFQREFNYFFEGIDETPPEDNQKIVFTTSLQINDGLVQYVFYDFKHDNHGELVPLTQYLEQVDESLIDRIESQVIKYIEGYVLEGVEQNGFADTVKRVLGKNDN